MSPENMTPPKYVCLLKRHDGPNRWICKDHFYVCDVCGHEDFCVACSAEGIDHEVSQMVCCDTCESTRCKDCDIHKCKGCSEWYCGDCIRKTKEYIDLSKEEQDKLIHFKCDECEKEWECDNCDQPIWCKEKKEAKCCEMHNECKCCS